MSRRRRPPDQKVEWNFFSFPVAFAFALGMFVAVMLYPLGFYLFIISLLLTSWGVAHMLNRWLRNRTIDKRQRKEEEEERERRALAARQAAARNDESSARRRRKRRDRRSPASEPEA